MVPKEDRPVFSPGYSEKRNYLVPQALPVLCLLLPKQPDEILPRHGHPSKMLADNTKAHLKVKAQETVGSLKTQAAYDNMLRQQYISRSHSCESGEE
jgi:hypothetical protein